MIYIYSLLHQNIFHIVQLASESRNSLSGIDSALERIQQNLNQLSRFGTFLGLHLAVLRTALGI